MHLFALRFTDWKIGVRRVYIHFKPAMASRRGMFYKNFSTRKMIYSAQTWSKDASYKGLEVLRGAIKGVIIFKYIRIV